MNDRTVLWLILFLATVAVFLAHDDYGVTWDEGVQAEYGELALDYFASGGKSTGALELEVRGLYGPVYQMLPATLYRGLDLPKYRTRHLFNGLLALLALPGLLLLARRFPSPLVPILAVVALLALPRFVGHAFNNSKDIPFAVAVVWFMLVSARLFDDREPRWRHVAMCAVALAAALWARPGGFPLLVLWLGVAGVAGLWMGSPRPTGAWRQDAVRASAAAVAVIAAAWALMVLPWPAAHPSPLAHPIASMGTAAAFPVELPVLFEGAVYASGELPRRYALEMLAVTTPPGLLALAILGGFLSLREAAGGTRRQPRAAAVLLLAWALLPLALVTLFRPNLYDGIRHLLFVLPALALLAGVGGAWLVERAPSVRWRTVALAVVAAVILAPFPAMLRLHPYQMTYFNAFVGGTEGADGRFETDYWASSYGEAIRWINGQATGEGGIRVLVAGTEFVRPAAAYAAAPGVEILMRADLDREGEAAPGPDYYLATTRYGLDRAFPAAPVVHTVGRDGAKFSVVKRLGGARGGRGERIDPSEQDEPRRHAASAGGQRARAAAQPVSRSWMTRSTTSPMRPRTTPASMSAASRTRLPGKRRSASKRTTWPRKTPTSCPSSSSSDAASS